MRAARGAGARLAAGVWICAWAFACALAAGTTSAEDAPAGDGDPDAPIGAVPASTIYDVQFALEPWTGDYPGMVERRMIRILVPYSMTHFFLDGATQRGVSAAAGRAVERAVNDREGLRTRPLNVVFVPVSRSERFEWLRAGLGDIVAGDVTEVEGLANGAALTSPLLRDVEALVVTGPGAPALETLEDLAGERVHVQLSSSHHEHVARLDRELRSRGLEPIEVVPLDEGLEPDEVLEMVAAGVVPVTVADRHVADLWARVLPGLTVRDELVVAPGRDLVWAVREGSAELRAVLDEIIPLHRQGTKFGNITLRRYLEGVRWIGNPAASEDRARYEAVRPLLLRYAERYDLDPLLLAAVAYQESRLDQAARSPAGAIGVMQLLPSTAEWLDVGDITELEPNVHAGARYLRVLLDEAAGPEVDSLNTTFFALASYNAGRTRIRRLRRETAERGLDPDVWIDNVELAAARENGRETVQFVRNVYKYRLTFRQVESARERREAVRVVD